MSILFAKIECNHFGVVIEKWFGIYAFRHLKIVQLFDNNVGETICFVRIAIITICVQFEAIDKCIRTWRIELIQHIRQNGPFLV